VSGGTPTTYTLFSQSGDGYLPANNPAGPGTGVQATDLFVGQAVGTYYESFISFDTSAVAGTITAVTLSLYCFNDTSLTDFTVEARLHDWGATLENGDWVAAASLGSKTLLASKTTVGINAAGYNDFVSEAAFPGSINQAGLTGIVLCSSRFRTGASPGGNEFVGFRGQEASGTSQDPKLVIEALV
jgi:hypothetical protein